MSISALFVAIGAVGGGFAVAVLVYLAVPRSSGLAAKKTEAKKSTPRSGFAAPKRKPLETFGPLLAGAVLAGMVTWGTGIFLPSLWVGTIGGQLAVTLSKRMIISKKRFARLKEVAVLYESTDLFMKAGFTTWQSLQMSIPLVNTLRPAVEKCLDRWAFGPLKAIRQFGEDVGIPEAQVLTGILMHATEGGVEKTAGVMAEEAARLEEIRKSLAETRIAAKPIYAAVYRFLPLTASLGMLLGPLAHRAVTMLNEMRFQ